MDITQFHVAAGVRHPLDRLVSLYFSPSRWMRQVGGKWERGTPHWDRDLFLSLVTQFEPAVSYLEVDGSILKPQAMLHFENLQPCLASFMHAVGIEDAPPLVCLNRGGVDPLELARAKSDKHLLEFAVDCWRKDFDFFGYPLPRIPR